MELISSTAMFIASRMASPPVTDPGAESGARPPILMGQSAAEALPPQRMNIAAHTMPKKHNILILFILLSLLSDCGVNNYRLEPREL
jgi:hypothetical protein